MYSRTESVDYMKLSEAASLVEVYTLCRVNMPVAYLREVARTQKYKFCGSDPMHLLPVPDLFNKTDLPNAQVLQVVGVS